MKPHRIVGVLLFATLMAMGQPAPDEQKPVRIQGVVRDALGRLMTEGTVTLRLADDGREIARATLGSEASFDFAAARSTNHEIEVSVRGFSLTRVLVTKWMSRKDVRLDPVTVSIEPECGDCVRQLAPNLADIFRQWIW